jgi:hypothetical protein
MSAVVRNCPKKSKPLPEGIETEVVSCTEAPVPENVDIVVKGANVPK